MAFVLISMITWTGLYYFGSSHSLILYCFIITSMDLYYFFDHINGFCTIYDVHINGFVLFVESNRCFVLFGRITSMGLLV